MSGERIARKVLFGQPRSTKPVGSTLVTLYSRMRLYVLLLNDGGGQVHGRRWFPQCMDKVAWQTSIDSGL